MAPRTTWRDGPQYIADRVTVVESGCWEWNLARQPYGYGIGSKDGWYLAHRLSWELHVGPIPAGLVIDHICVNPPCVRPDHLRPVTQKENVGAGGNAPRPTRKRGHEWINPYVYKGKRQCRPCHNALANASRKRAKEQDNNK